MKKVGQSGIAFDNQLIAEAVAEHAGKGQLGKRLTFVNDEERDRFIQPQKPFFARCHIRSSM